MVEYPSDWEKGSLKQIVGIITDGDWIEKEHIKSNGDYRIIQTGNIGIGKYIENSNHKKFMNQQSYEILKGNQIYSGDILISRLAEPAGRSIILPAVDKKMVTSVDVAIIRPDIKKFDSYFIMSLLNSSQILNKIKEEVAGTTHQRISRKNLENMGLTIPDLPEQKNIGVAMRSFDTHIDNLSELIEKKKMIRDGAIEELMSGKRRLEGFDGEWKNYTLEELCEPKGMVRGPFGGTLKKEYFVTKGYKVYEQKNAIYKSVKLGEYYIDEEKYRELVRFSVNKDDFIVSCSGTIGEIYRIPTDYEEGVINQALLKLTINKDVCDLSFFNHYFNWESFQSRIIDDTQGGEMKNLVGMDIFRKTSISVPSNSTEQQAIAEILTSMDVEIEHLEQEKEKYIDLKSGVMDDLLTGKIRLI